MKLLFLDDYRRPDDCLKYMHMRIGAENLIYDSPNWFTVKHYPAFVQYIEKNGLPDLISFDHDLADGHYHQNMQEGNINYQTEDFANDMHKTGYHCALWLTNYCMDKQLPLPKFLVHSMNPVGTENIKALLENFKRVNIETV
jgi:hypothetical protein